MYELRVFHPGSAIPADSVRLARATEVLTTIPRLLGRHAGCERIEVLADGDRLFAVDCQGQHIAA